MPKKTFTDTERLNWLFEDLTLADKILRYLNTRADSRYRDVNDAHFLKLSRVGIDRAMQTKVKFYGQARKILAAARKRGDPLRAIDVCANRAERADVRGNEDLRAWYAGMAHVISRWIMTQGALKKMEEIETTYKPWERSRERISPWVW